jgi:hypothetical protein
MVTLNGEKILDDVVRAYQDAYARHGQTNQLGQDMIWGTGLYLAASQEEAIRRVEPAHDERYKWFAPFGFARYADEQGSTWGTPGAPAKIPSLRDGVAPPRLSDVDPRGGINDIDCGNRKVGRGKGRRRFMQPGHRRGFGLVPDGQPRRSDLNRVAPQRIHVQPRSHRWGDAPCKGKVPGGDFGDPASNCRCIGIGPEQQQMAQNISYQALDRMEFASSDVLDLLDDVGQIEFIGQVVPQREAAQRRRLPFRPNQDIFVIQADVCHRRLLGTNLMLAG